MSKSTFVAFFANTTIKIFLTTKEKNSKSKGTLALLQKARQALRARFTSTKLAPLYAISAKTLARPSRLRYLNIYKGKCNDESL
jgi:hypothetical protein